MCGHSQGVDNWESKYTSTCRQQTTGCLESQSGWRQNERDNNSQSLGSSSPGHMAPQQVLSGTSYRAMPATHLWKPSVIWCSTQFIGAKTEAQGGHWKQPALELPLCLFPILCLWAGERCTLILTLCPQFMLLGLANRLGAIISWCPCGCFQNFCPLLPNPTDTPVPSISPIACTCRYF